MQSSVSQPAPPSDQPRYEYVHSLRTELLKEIREITGDPQQLFHIALTTLLLIASYPLMRLAKLELTGGPLRLLAFLPPIVTQGIGLAAVLFAIQFPHKAIATIRAGKIARFLFMVPVIALIFALYGWGYGILLSVGAIAVAEYFLNENLSWSGSLVRCGIPAIYFLIGFGVIYSLNDVIATFRFYGAYDRTLQQIDRRLLFGGSVAGISQWVQVRVGEWPFRIAEVIYYGAFVQFGAGIILVGILSGLSRGIRLVGTILLAYYAGLVWFFLWPSHGPYYLNSVGTIPRFLKTYEIQQAFLENARTLWHHAGTLSTTGGYYVAFPSLHIAQPLIILWFLRKYHRVVWVLAAYDLVLIPAILLLQWHYVVDVLGGVALAGLVLLVLNCTTVDARRFVQRVLFQSVLLPDRGIRRTFNDNIAEENKKAKPEGTQTL